MHEHGTNSVEAKSALHEISNSILKISDLCDPLRDHLLVFGDHGFMNFTKRLHINSLFKNEGWIQTQKDRILGWKVIAQTNCAQAPIFLRDPLLSPKVLKVLESAKGDAFQLLKRRDLDRLRAFPEAFCAVECKPGYSLGQNFEGPLIETLAEPRGEHGYLPYHPEMQTGFFVMGPNAQPGHNLGHIRILDIAPTAASILGLELPLAEGTCLRLKT